MAARLAARPPARPPLVHSLVPFFLPSFLQHAGHSTGSSQRVFTGPSLAFLTPWWVLCWPVMPTPVGAGPRLHLRLQSPAISC